MATPLVYPNYRGAGIDLCPRCAGRQYLGVAEAARHVRDDLHRRWPGVDFHVKSHSFAGGSSIDVEYIGGPPRKEVERTVKCHQVGGEHSDPMTDYCDITRFTHVQRLFYPATVQAAMGELGLPAQDPWTMGHEDRYHLNQYLDTHTFPSGRFREVPPGVHLLSGA